MHAGGIFFPGEVHLVDVVCGITLEERVVGVLYNRDLWSGMLSFQFRFLNLKNCLMLLTTPLLVSSAATAYCLRCFHASCADTNANGLRVARPRFAGLDTEAMPRALRTRGVLLQRLAASESLIDEDLVARNMIAQVDRISCGKKESGTEGIGLAVKMVVVEKGTGKR